MTKKHTTHYAYDYGILNFLGQTKTKRTLCGKTVGSHKISKDNPTCPDCQTIHAETEALVKELQAKNPSLWKSPDVFDKTDYPYDYT